MVGESGEGRGREVGGSASLLSYSSTQFIDCGSYQADGGGVVILNNSPPVESTISCTSFENCFAFRGAAVATASQPLKLDRVEFKNPPTPPARVGVLQTAAATTPWAGIRYEGLGREEELSSTRSAAM